MYEVHKDRCGYVSGIIHDGQWILHLETGTEFNEKNAEDVVRKLNRLSVLESDIRKSNRQLRDAKRDIGRLVNRDPDILDRLINGVPIRQMALETVIEAFDKQLADMKILLDASEQAKRYLSRMYDGRDKELSELSLELAIHRHAMKPVKDCREKWRGCEHDAETLSNRDCEAWEACKKAVRELNSEPEKEEHQS